MLRSLLLFDKYTVGCWGVYKKKQGEPLRHIRQCAANLTKTTDAPSVTALISVFFHQGTILHTQ